MGQIETKEKGIGSNDGKLGMKGYIYIYIHICVLTIELGVGIGEEAWEARWLA